MIVSVLSRYEHIEVLSLNNSYYFFQFCNLSLVLLFRPQSVGEIFVFATKTIPPFLKLLVARNCSEEQKFSLVFYHNWWNSPKSSLAARIPSNKFLTWHIIRPNYMYLPDIYQTGLSNISFLLETFSRFFSRKKGFEKNACCSNQLDAANNSKIKATHHDILTMFSARSW